MRSARRAHFAIRAQPPDEGSQANWPPDPPTRPGHDWEGPGRDWSFGIACASLGSEVRMSRVRAYNAAAIVTRLSPPRIDPIS